MTIDDFILDETSLALGRALHHHGLVAPSLRQIAGQMNTVPGTLLHHFGSKDRLLTFSADRLGDRCLRALRDRITYHRWDGFIPDGSKIDDVFLTRARLGLAAIARTLPGVGRTVARLRREEQELIWDRARADGADLEPDSPLLPLCADSLVGLWEAVCIPEPPLLVAEARERWRVVADLLRKATVV